MNTQEISDYVKQQSILFSMWIVKNCTEDTRRRNYYFCIIDNYDESRYIDKIYDIFIQNEYL